MAIELANKGYDVWLTNSRGSKYSRRHIRYDADKDPEFWNFSFIEMGQFDLPAFVDHILDRTGKEKLTYVGHSMGTTSMIYALATNEDYYKDRINLNVQLAPVASLTNTKSLFLKFIVKQGYTVYD